MGQTKGCLSKAQDDDDEEEEETESTVAAESRAASLRLPTALPVGGPRLPSPCVLCLVRPDADDFFGDVQAAGHPDSLQALRLAGAAVRMVRASCACQGRRLTESGEAVEMVGEASIRFSAPAPRGGAEELARGMSHLRCLAEALAAEGPVIVLEASSRLARGCQWSQVVSAASDAAARGDELLLYTSSSSQVGEASVASAYAVTGAGCRKLAQYRAVLSQLVCSADELVGALAGRRPAQSTGRPAGLEVLASFRTASAPLVEAGIAGASHGSSNARSATRQQREATGGVKVVIITLPHRADRRVEPLVGSAAAIAAMRDEGFDVEILRASCYCERDRLNDHGSLSCHTGDLQSICMTRYEGANKPMGKEESEQMRQFIDENYLSGADRLIMGNGESDGTVDGYVVDSNWPGATGCAMSHMRALVDASLAGYDFALVFEDDAVVPADVARARGWCESCPGKLCWCASSWAFVVEEAVELMRRAPKMDVLYLGIGEGFERPGWTNGLLRPKSGGYCFGPWGGDGSGSDSEEDLGGVTEIGYTWQAQALLYSRAALDDVLALRLWEQIWAHDETIPHLYGRAPWNHRYVEALRKAGWRRRWIAGSPTDFHAEQGWVLQLESFTTDDDGNLLSSGDLGLGSAWKSSNSAEF